MTKAEKFTDYPPFMVIKSAHETPFIASFPHSGMYIPPELRGMYTDEHLNRLRNTDWHLPELYSFLPDIGVDCVIANFSRYVVDANRGMEQKANGENYRNSLVYKRDTWGAPILRTPDIDLQIDFRIANFYDPYHQALQDTINRKREKFGCAYLFDLHSFAVNVYPHQNPNCFPPDCAADIYLGAGDFSEFGPNLKTALFAQFNRQGLLTGDTPNFPGGHIPRFYGIQNNVEVCMVELKYRTYMAETAERGDHIPTIDWSRAKRTQQKLRGALTGVVNAPLLKANPSICG